MSKSAKALLVIFLLYVLGFFLVPPIFFTGIGFGWYWLGNAVEKYENVAYKPIITWSGENSILAKLRYENTVFWCHKFEHCHVD
jgi:hypothetical protein